MPEVVGVRRRGPGEVVLELTGEQGLAGPLRAVDEEDAGALALVRGLERATELDRERAPVDEPDPVAVEALLLEVLGSLSTATRNRGRSAARRPGAAQADGLRDGAELVAGGLRALLP